MSSPETDDNFLFIYELDPARFCANFRFDSGSYVRNIIPPRNASFSVWQEMLVIFYRIEKGKLAFDLISNDAQSIVTAVVSAYAYFTGKPFRFTRRNWVEFEGISRKTVVGKADQLIEPELNHPDNRPFKDIDQLMALVLNNAPLARALDDFYSCLSKVNPDFYFYAYRAVEDIRTHFDSAELDDERKKGWDAMNKALNREKQDYDQLKRFAETHRHTNMLGEQVDKDVASRQVLFVRSLIDDFIAYLRILELTHAFQPTDALKVDNSPHASRT